jgi:zinc transporter ZupT
MSYFFPFVSVLIGYGLALFWQPKSRKNLKLILAFSGSFLLSMTVIHLLPELFQSGEKHLGLWIMGGIVTQIVLEYFSKGAEHGHVHKDKSHAAMAIPWALFVSLAVHALFEGIPVHQYPALAFGIAIHHFPIAIILTLFLVHAHLKPWTVAVFMVLFAAMTPLGTLLAQWPQISAIENQLTAWVIGILFHIASTIIFESSEGHTFNLAKLAMIVFGILAAIPL